jgi:hypothetical protein
MKIEENFSEIGSPVAITSSKNPIKPDKDNSKLKIEHINLVKNKEPS